VEPRALNEMSSTGASGFVTYKYMYPLASKYPGYPEKMGQGWDKIGIPIKKDSTHIS
jgi:hypothetical protein